jgi:dihydrolipoamide dehydrogenase
VAERRCKVAIIGAGTAGLAAHAIARRHTDSLLLIEAGPHGTTCARVGCMPSKLLIAAADVRQHIDEAAGFGLQVAAVTVDREAVMRRVRALRDDFVAGVLQVVAAIPAEQRLEGSARFEGPGRLRVGELLVCTDSVIIATGSRPHIPAAYRGLGRRLLTSDDVFELPRLPESLAVIGGGVIGLELGQAMHRLGVRVRLFNRALTLGPQGDRRFGALATQLLGARLPCELGVEPTLGGEHDDGAELHWQRGGLPCTERFEYVLVAAGRRPALDALALPKAGVALDAAGLPCFDPCTMRCGDSAVFVAGDVDGLRPVLHDAAEDGRIAGENAARYPDIRAHQRRVRLEIAFTDPQFATVGQTLDSLPPEATAIGEVSFADQGRSRVIGRAAGMARLYGEHSSGKLVGAQLIGPAAEHLAHLLAWVMQRELTVNEILELPFYHPVIEEGLRSALKDLRHALLRGAPPRDECMDCGPGT